MSVEAEKVGNRIHAKIPYDNGAGPIEAKMVAGARWNPSAKSWTYPLDMEICRLLREQFGSRLRVGVELAAWATEALKTEQAQIGLRSATDAALSRVQTVAPVLADAMGNRTYQRVGAKFIVDGKAVLIADEPGLGKTLEALAAVIENGAKTVLVFAKKKAVETVWVPEIKRWLGEAAEVFPLMGTGPQRKKVLASFLDSSGDKIRFVVGNIEMARWPKGGEPKFPEMFLPSWDAIIVDESHKGLIGKHTMSDNITQTRNGMMKLQLAENGLKIALSGTPGRGKLLNFWGTLNWLRPKVFTGYWRYAEMYFEVAEDNYGHKVVGGLREDKVEAFDRMLAPIMLRRTKAEVAPEMPARQYAGSPLPGTDPQRTTGIWLEMTPKQKKAYRSIQDDAKIKLASGDLNVNGVLAEMTRLSQFADCAWDFDENGDLQPVKGTSAKYDWLLEKIEEWAENGQKVLIASRYTRVVNAFSRWLREDGYESYVLTGETTDKQAVARVSAFNDPADTVPVFFINTLAGGESINLDGCADDVVFIDETFIPDDQEQVENRIHRMSRIHQVTVWYLRSLDTIEQSICEITGAREAILKGRLDGSRGVDFQRLLAA